MRTRGFGLIEVMISGSILMVGIISVVHTITIMEGIHAHQRYITGAVHVCEGTLEELIGRYLDDPELATGTTTIGPEYSMEGRVMPATQGFFTTSWTVSADTPVVNMREIVVTVSWKEGVVAKSFSLKAARS